MTTVVEIPFGLPGRVFRSPMPYGAFDPFGEALSILQREEVRWIFALVEGQEWAWVDGVPLPTLYERLGMHLHHLPVGDFAVPEAEALERSVLTAMQLAREGHNLAVHCFAGLGRTGVFLTRMAQHARHLPAMQALAWVRQYVPGAVESAAQERFLAALDSPGEEV